jgi:hypothetical protein
MEGPDDVEQSTKILKDAHNINYLCILISEENGSDKQSTDHDFLKKFPNLRLLQDPFSIDASPTNRFSQIRQISMVSYRHASIKHISPISNGLKLHQDTLEELWISETVDRTRSLKASQLQVSVKLESLTNFLTLRKLAIDVHILLDLENGQDKQLPQKTAYSKVNPGVAGRTVLWDKA